MENGVVVILLKILFSGQAERDVGPWFPNGD